MTLSRNGHHVVTPLLSANQTRSSVVLVSVGEALRDDQPTSNQVEHHRRGKGGAKLPAWLLVAFSGREAFPFPESTFSLTSRPAPPPAVVVPFPSPDDYPRYMFSRASTGTDVVAISSFPGSSLYIETKHGWKFARVRTRTVRISVFSFISIVSAV